jgi:hypothetical protein
MLYLNQVLAFFKKIPGWLWGALLVSIAVLAYLASYRSKMRNLANIKTQRLNSEIAKAKAINEAQENRDEKEEEITEKFNVDSQKLKEKEDKLRNEILAGPTGIASAWNRRLKERKKK